MGLGVNYLIACQKNLDQIPKLNQCLTLSFANSGLWNSRSAQKIVLIRYAYFKNSPGHFNHVLMVYDKSSCYYEANMSQAY